MSELICGLRLPTNKLFNMEAEEARLALFWCRKSRCELLFQFLQKSNLLCTRFNLLK